MLLNSDASQKKEIRTRVRASTSCGECKRRKQKCNQAKPCNNCSRRYPPVACLYDALRKSAKYKGNVVDLNPIIKLEQPNPNYPGRSGADFLTVVQPHYGSRSPSPLTGQLRYLQLPTRHPSRGSWNSSPGSQEDRASSEEIDYGSDRDLSTAFRMRRYYPYPELYHSPYHSSEIPEGGVDLEALKYLPIEPSKRHAQLFHFFMRRLSAYIFSIDGADPSVTLSSQWISFMVHSPIAIYLTILTASYFQAATRGIHYEKAVEVMSTKVKLITLINEHIASNGKGVSDDSIAAVMSLTYNELVYADERSTLAHMRGLREMIATRGGISKISFPLLRMMLLRTDFQIACTYECGLFLHPTLPVPTLHSYPIMVDSPLVLSPHSFVSSLGVLGISEPTARILDDMRFLTSSVVQLERNGGSDGGEESGDALAKFLTTVHWIHERLSAPSSPDPDLDVDFVYQTVRTTALIYSSSILHRTPLSLSPALISSFSATVSPLLTQLWSTLWRVPLPRWKLIPGIFFWVLVVASPYTRDKPEGRFIKGLMPAAVMAVTLGCGSEGELRSVEGDWPVLKGVVGSFLGVQRWLRGAGGAGQERRLSVIGEVSKELAIRKGSGKSGTSLGSPKGGLPSWSLRE